MECHPPLVYFSTGLASSAISRRLQKVTNDCIELYLKSLPPDCLPIVIAPFDIDDVVPEPDKIIDQIRGLRNGESPEPSNIRAEHLNEWVQEAYWEIIHITENAAE